MPRPAWGSSSSSADAAVSCRPRRRRRCSHRFSAHGARSNVSTPCRPICATAHPDCCGSQPPRHWQEACSPLRSQPCAQHTPRSSAICGRATRTKFRPICLPTRSRSASRSRPPHTSHWHARPLRRVRWCWPRRAPGWSTPCARGTGHGWRGALSSHWPSTLRWASAWPCAWIRSAGYRNAPSRSRPTRSPQRWWSTAWATLSSTA